MAPLTHFLLFTLFVVVARAAVSSIEVYDGNYYGLDDPHGTLTIPTPGPSASTEQSTRRPGSNRRGNNNRGNSGQGHGHHRPHHHGNTTWSDEQKLTHVCSMIRPASTPSSSDTSTRRPGRQQHHQQQQQHGAALSRKLQMMSPENRQTTIEMWNKRKQDMLRCCDEVSTDRKLQCVNEARLSRYARVCRGEEPLCPWSQFLPVDSRHTRPGQSGAAPTPATSNTTTICCARQGSERLECFATARAAYRQQYEQMKGRTHGPHGGAHGGSHGSHGRGSHEERRRTDPDTTRVTPTTRRVGGGGRKRPDGSN